ncbi:hypothetical protein MBOE_57860 [Mycolicibacterium boenickei]|uniref:Uncharacterized protein n=1 Tax=Mycolicibacterium boenickei TaxID=146017 RepID=A0ABN5ZJ41_9MYCO|nr:hypothetical protein MBOE_57860 [Mycolicibacterium boenickei]
MRPPAPVDFAKGNSACSLIRTSVRAVDETNWQPREVFDAVQGRGFAYGSMAPPCPLGEGPSLVEVSYLDDDELRKFALAADLLLKVADLDQSLFAELQKAVRTSTPQLLRMTATTEWMPSRGT